MLTPETAETVGRRVGIDDIESPLLREAVEMWTQKKGAGRFPSRPAVTPRDMARFLRHVTLYRITADGSDFEYRVMGDAAVQAWGGNFIGLDTAGLNALHPGMGDVMRRVCASVARRGEPLVLRGVLSKGVHEHIDQETIFLPLGPDESTVDHILSIGSYTAKRPAGA